MTYQEWIGFMQQYLQSVEKYSSIYSGQQIDTAVGKALNPDTTPTASSSALITSGAVQSATVPVVGKGVNLLDNWYFVGGGSQQGGGQFPINQRGLTTYNRVNYGIDRWTDIGASADVTINSGYISLAADAVQFQFLETHPKSGEKYTASVLFDTGLKSMTFTAGADASLDCGGIYLRCYDNLFSRGFAFGFNSVTSTKNIIAVKLELGDTQTLAHQENGVWVLNDPAPNYQQELAKCQRYYQRAAFLRYAGCTTSAGAYITYIPPVPFRATPTIEVTLLGGCVDRTGTYLTLSNPRITSLGYNYGQILVECSTSSTPAAGPAYIFDTQLGFSADL